MSSALKDRVRQAFEGMAQGDPSTFLALLSPDVTYRLIGSTSLSGTHRGIDRVMNDLIGPLAAQLGSPLRLHVEHLAADADRVYVQARGEATLRSAAPYNNVYCFAFRFAGERVVELTEYLDTALISRAFGVPAEPAALLQAMDLNMWEMFRDSARCARGGEIFETPAFWMNFAPRGSAFHNMVMVRDAVDVDALCEAMRRFYVARGHVFSVALRAHADEACETALRARGFNTLMDLPGMALLGDPGTTCAPAGLEIRPTTDDQGRRDYLYITAEAYATYGAPREYAEDVFCRLESICAPHVQGFVGYVEGRPAAAAGVWVTHGVGGIGWVGTVPEFRGRGYAEAVTWAAVREGFRRGAAFANLQASPMGRPVYERMGFITPTHYRIMIGEP
jgi:ketosteroid isomerase-like protein/ribosomal protein S18 acetylase RimI-like enzyme